MPNSPKAWKECSKRERELEKVSKPKDPQVEAKKGMKTMLREMREAVREKKREQEREGIPKSSERDKRGDQSNKKGISGSERGDGRKTIKSAGGEGRLDEKDENDRGKDGTKRKEGEEE
ncbi:hypothetical protein MTP99_009217 [Tenebrio molitor]|nr:hypothetical protein MTP99_009217 [Tenebrio molitor]